MASTSHATRTISSNWFPQEHSSGRSRSSWAYPIMYKTCPRGQQKFNKSLP